MRRQSYWTNRLQQSPIPKQQVPEQKNNLLTWGFLSPEWALPCCSRMFVATSFLVMLFFTTTNNNNNNNNKQSAMAHYQKIRNNTSAHASQLAPGRYWTIHRLCHWICCVRLRGIGNSYVVCRPLTLNLGYMRHICLIWSKAWNFFGCSVFGGLQKKCCASWRLPGQMAAPWSTSRNHLNMLLWILLAYMRVFVIFPTVLRRITRLVCQ